MVENLKSVASAINTQPTKDEISALLIAAMKTDGFGDLYLASDRVPAAKIHGKPVMLSARKWIHGEIEEVVRHLDGPSGPARLLQGNQIDRSFEVVHREPGGKAERFRFRLNMTAIRSGRGDAGFAITARGINWMPPKLDQLGLEPEIKEQLFPRQGLNIIAGSTGDGKSTTLAAALRDLIETDEIGKVINTYEEPIEFVYDGCQNLCSIVHQSEVPIMVRSFADGIRASMRRNPDIILVGELRDNETIAAAIEASMTGHLVWGTLHANRVADVMRRMVSRFDKEEQASRLGDIISSTRLLMVQRLVPKVGGGRVALREYLVCDDEVRGMLFEASLATIAHTVDGLVRERGKTLLASAKEAHAAGMISDQVLTHMEKTG
ncbi:type IV pilus twitching motility protein PilT [Alcanivorax sp. 1008]|uniref:type IV pilus twitching motility protein PilT n=1 Tax=Alcanivorax sp. 1008 TaxID=2816853 RepID=UPI001DC3FA31|nr:ATPase, T2SS/T4P/T4SS family [Alcanivorax sp. 1008]MCC1496715.1 Flp pilus assembly complex ATPase component TadA [Alcanivorax sp. 1008]